MTWEELVQDEAAKHGIELTSDEAGWILWNKTGYPSFHDGNPEKFFREQVGEWCQEVKSN